MQKAELGNRTAIPERGELMKYFAANIRSKGYEVSNDESSMTVKFSYDQRVDIQTHILLGMSHKIHQTGARRYLPRVVEGNIYVDDRVSYLIVAEYDKEQIKFDLEAVKK